MHKSFLEKVICIGPKENPIKIINMIEMGMRKVALPFDYLDSMAWSIAASAILVGIAALRLPYKAAKDSVEEDGKNLRRGLAAALGVSGLYLFITGIAISFTWPYAFSGGVYNILFGGIAALGGLAVLATAVALFFNGGLSAVSYFAAVVGIYAAIDAYAMVNYRLTSSPELSALGYLAFTAAAFMSIPATHSDNKWLRRIFALFAFLFAIAWVYEAYNFTTAHLKPPPPST